MRDATMCAINMMRSMMNGAPNSNREEVFSTLRRVLAHSHRSSFTTSAPPGYQPGKSFLYLAKPPAPQAPQLQSSILHNVQSTWFSFFFFVPAHIFLCCILEGASLQGNDTVFSSDLIFNIYLHPFMFVTNGYY